jgi:hypothetical protein
MFTLGSSLVVVVAVVVVLLLLLLVVVLLLMVWSAFSLSDYRSSSLLVSSLFLLWLFLFLFLFFSFPPSRVVVFTQAQLVLENLSQMKQTRERES